MMQLIVLYGAPGVGKLTVARELADRTGFKLLHNHLTIDPVIALFPFGSPAATRLIASFRRQLFEEAARARLPGVIFTLVYARGDDDAYVQEMIDAVEPHGGAVRFVLLTCAEEELLRRVADESRGTFGKLRDPEAVRTLLRRYDLLSPVPHRESLVLDTTTRSPQETAAAIVAHFGL